jgi:D-glycero-alpha-D-manno-heptose 1-phosphate guanylyltransferase
MQVKEAIILAGGMGTRLRDAVPDLPKCMAPVIGKPFLQYVLDYCRQQGIERIIFSLGYKHEVIEAYATEHCKDLTVVYSIEETPLGTGGAIKKACGFANDDTVVVLNGDTLFQVNLEKMTGFHHLCAAHCTLALKPMTNFDRYGIVELNKDDSIQQFKEKQWTEAGTINGGVYLLHVEKFLQESLPEIFSFEKDYLETYYQHRRMYGYIQDSYFIDIGIPEDFQRAQTELEQL